MLLVKDFDDYEIISMSNGEKLERWKDYYLLRPDPEIIWKEDMDKSLVHAYYHRSNKGGGYWETNTNDSDADLDPILENAVIKFVDVTVDNWSDADAVPVSGGI